MSKQLDKCPFCNEELERHCTSRYYMHKLNGCILQHFCFEADDELYIDLWNTRKPMERIVKRLEEPTNYTIVKGKHFTTVERAIEIVKEEGGLNEKM